MSKLVEEVAEKMVEKRAKKDLQKLTDGNNETSDGGSINEWDGSESRKSSYDSDWEAQPRRRDLPKRLLSRIFRRKRGEGSFSKSDDESDARTEFSDSAVDSSGPDSSILSDYDEDDVDGTATTQSSTQSTKALMHRCRKELIEAVEPRPAVLDDDQNTQRCFNIRVRIHEARELQGEDLNPLALVVIAGKSRTTKSRRGSICPKWDQPLNFSFNKSLDELCQSNVEFSVYNAHRLIRDSFIGTFVCNLGMIFKQPHQSLVKKWLVLGPRTKEEDAGILSTGDIRGFLKVTVIICDPGQQLPSIDSQNKSMNSEEDDDVLFGARFRNHTLKIRVYELSSVVDFVRYPKKSKISTAPAKLAVQVAVGKFKERTDFKTASDETVMFMQEISLPIMWPTVANQIRFRLLVNKDKDRNVYCTRSLNLRQICQPGEEGFLPAFGPSFVSLYGPDRVDRSCNARESAMGKYDGIIILVEISYSESAIPAPTISHIAQSALEVINIVHRRSDYSLFCSLFACNAIAPQFGSSNVQLAVSIGEYGNGFYSQVPPSTSRTLTVMPAFDTDKFYAMPWGNLKPVCEVPCSWERIIRRMEASNALIKISEMLEQSIESAKIHGGSHPQESELASILIQALEQVTILSEALEVDRFLRRFVNDLIDMKWEKCDPDDVSDCGIHQLTNLMEQLRAVAVDPQISIPDIVIHMFADRKLVAYGRMPSQEVFYSKTGRMRGRRCGQLLAIPLQWPNRKAQTDAGDMLPAVLHARFWLGPAKYRNRYRKLVEPGRLHYYAELFINQKRSLIGSSWSETSDRPYPVSDESGAVELNRDTIRPPAGWRFEGDWQLRRSHDMWVGRDAGHKTFVDEIFEVQAKRNDEWKPHGYTGYNGDTIASSLRLEPPRGWEYENGWELDLHCPGDEEGWSYSINEEFWNGPGSVDFVERCIHAYRRRAFKARRRMVNNQEISYHERFEDVNVFRELLDPDGWEYARNAKQPFHIQAMPFDRFRRQRFLRELVQTDSCQQKMAIPIRRRHEETSTVVDEFICPRIYEVHDAVSKWQLRAYILWARDLQPTTRAGSRAFVRVFFMNRCQTTAVVERTVNPIWNETLLFDRMLIPGGAQSMARRPPTAVLQLMGEELNESEVFLGRAMVQPVVTTPNIDGRASARWYPLCFRKQKSRGSILVSLELFQADPICKTFIPIHPALKSSEINQFEIPTEMRPKLEQYNVTILCWGVRNLTRYQLSSVRSPFVKVSVGGQEARTDTIKNIVKNPNFQRPLISIEGVMLPVKLYYAPPITLNLYDTRSFGRNPMVGVCVIKSFDKYFRSQPPKSTKDDSDWENFDVVLKKEMNDYHRKVEWLEAKMEQEMNDDFDEVSKPKVDWWSKYYASTGQMGNAPGFEASGIEKLVVFDESLEDVGEYRGFGDFLDTFYFRKVTKGNFDDPEQQELRGEMKGRLFIMPGSARMTMPPGIEFNGPVECTLRVYVVRAYELISRRRNGICDAYISIRCGKKKKQNKKAYISNSTSPIFGQILEMDITLPMEKDLTITLKDKRSILADEEIGNTVIDLENRLLTKYRATVGLSAQHTIFGSLTWRDQMTPLEILSRYCKRMQYPAPIILRSTGDCDDGLELFGYRIFTKDIEPEEGALDYWKLGSPLQRLALFVLHKIGLVPEHVETRTLYNSINPDMECGQVELWIDLFPKLIGPIPPPVDISPRKPVKFQLRIAVFKLRNVIFTKRSFGKPAADLFVRILLNGHSSEKTDIHYGSLDGAASFNWRFVSDFDYDPWEQMIVAYNKDRWFRKKTEEFVEPIISVQIWDNNKFARDKCIGEMKINLLAFEEAQMDVEEMQNVKYPKATRCCCIRLCGFCWHSQCCKKNRDKKIEVMSIAPLYLPNVVGIQSLFEQKNARGWWPCVSGNVPISQRAASGCSAKKKPFDDAAKRKKDDDYEIKQYVTGAIEMDIQLVTAEEARRDPVGKKRKKPNHSPFLGKPDRPKIDSFWLTSRLKAFFSTARKKCGWQVLCVCICTCILILFILAVIWQAPSIASTMLFQVMRS